MKVKLSSMIIKRECKFVDMTFNITVHSQCDPKRSRYESLAHVLAPTHLSHSSLYPAAITVASVWTSGTSLGASEVSSTPAIQLSGASSSPPWASSSLSSTSASSSSSYIFASYLIPRSPLLLILQRIRGLLD